jgi:hypothetical protein
MATFSLMFAVSCSTTTLKTVWKDDNYQGGKLKEVLIIGVAINQTMRRLFEDEFASQLKDHRLEAIASYTIIPSEGMLDKSTVDSKVKTLGVDTVLVTSLVEKTKERVSAPPSAHYRSGSRYRSDWYNYYSNSYRTSHYVDNYYEYEVVNLETNIYDTKTGKLIWSGLSETYVQGKGEEDIKSFIKVIMKSLSDSQLI